MTSPRTCTSQSCQSFGGVSCGGPNQSRRPGKFQEQRDREKGGIYLESIDIESPIANTKVKNRLFQEVLSQFDAGGGVARETIDSE